MKTRLSATAVACALVACSHRESVSPPQYHPPLACAGKAAPGLADHLLVGFAGEDATAAKPGFDVRYQYLAGGIPRPSGCTGCNGNCPHAWWGCWQEYDQPPGLFVTRFIDAAEQQGQIPMFTYYEILQSSGVSEGTPEATDAANDLGFMTAYFDDFRFFLEQIGTHRAFIHIEPDFWGYAEHAAIAGHTDAHGLSAQVALANPTDCGTIENEIAGMGACLIAMVAKYAPQAQVGLHGSAWGSNWDAILNTDPSHDVAADGTAVGTFLSQCGAGSGDFVVVDMADRDAGYYATQGRQTWLDSANRTLPDFDQAFTWSGAVAAAAGRPLIWWQLPLGNTGLQNVSGAWVDNRVEYFFQHPDRVAESGAVGMAFGAGADGQTTPESDGGLFAASAAALAAAGGQPLCP